MFHSRRFTLVIAIAALIFSRCAFGEQASPSLPASQTIVADDPDQFTLSGAGRSKADANIVGAAEQPFLKAWHVKVREKVGADYNLQFICKPKAALNAGDVIS